nr:PREDICTED: uncharacterized protein LOC107828556 [Nicotiana tabacum]
MQSLSVRIKLGFISGECKRLNSQSIDYRQWVRCDDMVTSQILNSLSKDIADSIEYANDAIELWIELKDYYEQTNAARLYQIQKEINDLTQGALDITNYYTKMKKLWEELSNMSMKAQCNCQYNCGAKEKLYKAEQDRHLIQFLMGINEMYTVVRGSILMIHLPSLAQAFSLLIYDEKQREMRPSNQLVFESTSLHMNAQGNTISNTQGNANFRTNYRANIQSIGGRTSRSFCDYCKITGHTRDRCYKLHDYPQNYTQGPRINIKGKHIMANAHGAPTEELFVKEDGSSSQDKQHNVATIGITKDQYGQLVNLLQHLQSTNGEDFADTHLSSGAVNFVGIMVCSSSVSHGSSHCKCFRTMFDTWIMDSSASLRLSNVALPNGYKVKVTKVGGVALTSQITLHKVLFVIAFKFNLISISSMTAYLNSLIAFTASSCLLQAPSIKIPLVIGKIKGGLYLPCSHFLDNGSSISNVSVTSTLLPHCDVNTPQCQSLSPVNSFADNKTQSTALHFYDFCQCSSIPHDNNGPYHVPTNRNQKYFLTMVDDYNRAIWTHLLSCKSIALQIIQTFVSQIETQFQKSIQSVRDVVFYETVFPFASPQSHVAPFPSSAPFLDSFDTTNTPHVAHLESFPSHSPELQSSPASPSVSPPPEHTPTLRRSQR